MVGGSRNSWYSTPSYWAAIRQESTTLCTDGPSKAKTRQRWEPFDPWCVNWSSSWMMKRASRLLLSFLAHSANARSVWCSWESREWLAVRILTATHRFVLWELMSKKKEKKKAESCRRIVLFVLCKPNCGERTETELVVNRITASRERITQRYRVKTTRSVFEKILLVKGKVTSRVLEPYCAWHSWNSESNSIQLPKNGRWIHLGMTPCPWRLSGKVPFPRLRWQTTATKCGTAKMETDEAECLLLSV